MSKTYVGEAEAQSSIEWLNMNGKENERRIVFERVANILASLKALAPLTRGKGERDEAALASLNRNLRDFKLAPGARVNRNTGQLELTFDDESDVDTWLYGSGFEVVLDLYRLAQMGLVDRISQCKMCASWFFSKLPQHVCCSKECSKEFEKTPEKRSIRNERLKRNRAIQKDSHDKVKKLIGYSKPKPRSRGRSK